MPEDSGYTKTETKTGQTGTSPKDALWTLDWKKVTEQLGTGVNGLSQEEARSRLEKYGPNQIEEKAKIHPLKIFLDQFKSFLVLILLGAVAISLFLAVFYGETSNYLDATAIIIIVILNAIFGFMQEFKAEKAIEALKKMIVAKARVIRDGKEMEISAAELVPGDIVVLEAGDQVPADMRLMEAANLQTNEASLTGESMPVLKQVEAIPKQELALGDRVNLAFLGTYVETGTGKGIVTATGMATEMGKIAHMVQEAPEVATPLQIKLQQLGRFLGMLILAVVVIVFIAGFLVGKPPFEMFWVAVALAVAAIPEGLPAIVTLTMGIGVERMAKRKAIIRKLPSVETLGSATFICTDKTGTLTKNEMTAVKIWTFDKLFEVSGTGYEPKGDFHLDGRVVKMEKEKDLPLLLKAGVLCNEAKLETETKEGVTSWKILGDPTEGALIVAAEKATLSHEELKRANPQMVEFPFDADRKRMSVICEERGKRFVWAKGAPESILSISNKISKEGKSWALSASERKKILEVNEKLAGLALRVLAIAYKPIEKKEKYAMKDVESGLIFLGLVGMIDPPREEVKEAIKKCKTAGIKVSMITGDHKITAEAIARQLGLLEERGELVLEGVELEKMSDAELERMAEKVRVYARISPEHKKKIIRALQKKAQTVAVTGDGVNDAPALKKADIGVAMGITGTDVAKEAADMVLADDNFATLVNAVEEGRTIFANIKRSVLYLLRGNIGEVAAVFLATVMWPAAPLILLPLQILLINLITDGAPALGLGMEPPEPDVMRRPPRRKEAVITRSNMAEVLTLGAFTAAATLAIFHLEFNIFRDPVHAQTAALATLMTIELLFALDMRSDRLPIIRKDFFANRFLLLTVISSFLAVLAVIYFPPLQFVFRTTALGLQEWALVAAAGAAIIFAADVRKRMLK